jgi:DNA primase
LARPSERGEAGVAREWSIADVLDRTDLRSLLDEYAVPDREGRRWHCPLSDHDDHHASVTMHRDHRGHERWRCWSGDRDHRGDAIDLLQAVRRCDRKTAIDELASRAGMSPDRDLPPIPKRRPAPKPATQPDDRVIAYATVCARLLWSPLGAEVREWLHGRGFDDDVLRANRVGADPGRARLRRGKGIPYGAGPGATFPALNPAGEIRYVQTRALEPRPGYGKYDNPSAAMAPNPRLSVAFPPTRNGSDQLVVCEGIPDSLVAAQAGFRAIGLLGTNALDDSVAARIANLADNNGLDVTVVVDVDDTGTGRSLGAQLVARLEAEHGVAARIIEPPEGQDLNTWALADQCWPTRLALPDSRREVLGGPDVAQE